MEAAAAPPPPPPAEPRLSVGGVISEAFDLYGKHAAALLGTAVIVFVVAGVLQGILTDDHGIVLRVIASIIGLIASTLYTGFVVTLVADVRDGRQDFSVGQMISSASEAIPRLIGNAILFGIAVGIGFILLIVPGLILLTFWSVGAPSIVVENAGPLEAFGRSYCLVKGEAWSVFGALVIVFLILVAIGIVLGIIATPIGNGATVVASIISNIITAPVFAIAVSVMFFELGGGRPGGASPALTESPPPAAPEA